MGLEYEYEDSLFTRAVYTVLRTPEIDLVDF